MGQCPFCGRLLPLPQIGPLTKNARGEYVAKVTSYLCRCVIQPFSAGVPEQNEKSEAGS